MVGRILICDADVRLDNWVSVPANSIVTIHKQTVMLHPIMDEFYVEDSNQDRSSCFAVSKGLVSTAPGTTVQPQNDVKAPAFDMTPANQCAVSH